MYQREMKIWQKHLDFILLDALCLQVAYVAAYIFRHGFFFPYSDFRYRNLGVILFLVQICAGFFMENYKNILRRSFIDELKKTILLITVVILVIFAYLFVTKTAFIFSRAVLLQLWMFGVGLIYCERIAWKRVVRRRMRDRKYLQAMIIVVSSERAADVVQTMRAKPYTGFYIEGIILTDIASGKAQQEISGVPVVADLGSSLEYLKGHAVDEVFVDYAIGGRAQDQLLRACEEMGVTTHVNIGYVKGENTHTFVENLTDYMVVTRTIKVADPRQLFVKRVMDIAGGIVGLLMTAVIAVIFGPVIYIQSPGPIFFSQKRVGRNGRIITIYKFRSMYPDAEERKKELEEKNKMQGLMFKVENDPRIIPIGHFMRKASLDEFPQFWNVLKGEMSLVGTRPPTVDEYEQYELHHKARLAMKPGLTGMWQVNGRSDIVDFEEVVRLDKQYITEWDIGLDIRILLQTVKIVITGKGSE
ncbi:sugar transferase [Mordavella massiliensis]|uniref:Sugar transferase n=1 Tax=Mordavella massiliensis TaxID=1871024 RepID=A0A938XBY2_9CLOT|nr:sugar transferase [Mordavella massiliensis]MBM6948706.1 sugar transferase [Mordavella massiliensis]